MHRDHIMVSVQFMYKGLWRADVPIIYAVDEDSSCFSHFFLSITSQNGMIPLLQPIFNMAICFIFAAHVINGVDHYDPCKMLTTAVSVTFFYCCLYFIKHGNCFLDSLDKGTKISLQKYGQYEWQSNHVIADQILQLHFMFKLSVIVCRLKQSLPQGRQGTDILTWWKRPLPPW